MEAGGGWREKGRRGVCVKGGERKEKERWKEVEKKKRREGWRRKESGRMGGRRVDEGKKLGDNNGKWVGSGI